MARAITRQPRVRRKRQWIRETTLFTEIANNASLALLEITNAEYTALGFGDPTVVRIRGTLGMILDTATVVANASQRLAMGILTQRGGATSTGTLPIADLNEAWLYWGMTYLSAPDVAGGGLTGDQLANARVDFDVKAMRVLRGLDKLTLIVQNPGDSAAHVFVGASWSVLLQE